ncbi:MAG TPA: hypothetical protein VF041_03650 [Gemmatimonadaceae bacterium]
MDYLQSPRRCGPRVCAASGRALIVPLAGAFRVGRPTCVGVSELELLGWHLEYGDLGPAELATAHEAIRRERTHIATLWKRDGIMSETSYLRALEALAHRLERHLRDRNAL